LGLKDGLRFILDSAPILSKALGVTIAYRLNEMFNMHLLGKLVQYIVLSSFLIACSKPDVEEAVPGAESSAPAPQIARPMDFSTPLPDFASLVKQHGASVVNINTVRTTRLGPSTSPFPGIPEDDPFFEFFRRFLPPQPSPREFRGQSLGSGFIISEDGYILTNAHVVAEADEVNVRLTDNREFDAKVVGTDPPTDVALLKIDAKGLPVAPLGNSKNAEVGEWVAAIGSPFGFDNSVTAGIISVKGRTLPDGNYVSFLQTDVAVNPGNSGGPLFNLNGEVIGINSQISYGQNIDPAQGSCETVSLAQADYTTLLPLTFCICTVAIAGCRSSLCHRQSCTEWCAWS
jgi:serine protease Do